jgi:hypothetical protein
MLKLRFIHVLAGSLALATFASAKELPVKGIIPDPPSICDAVAGNLVTNCGFELGLSGWTETGNNTFTFAAPMPGIDPNSGSDYASLGNETEAFISQTLVTVPGQAYNVSWYLEVGEVGGASGPNDLHVTWGGAPVYSATDLSFTTSYKQYSFTEIAPSTSTVLKFGSTDVPDYLFLDDVVVNAVPEPGYFAAAGLGLLALLFADKRRRASAGVSSL